MLKLRTILLSNTLYIFILLIVLFISLNRILLEKEKTINDIKIPIDIKVSNYYYDKDKLVIESNKYHLKGTYYFKTKDINIKLGDTYRIYGEVSIPDKKGLFNYQRYLKTKKIYYLINISKLKRIKSSNNIYYYFKNIISNNFNNNAYLYTFILGDKTYLNDEIKYSYQENGISHLFAISGMHITLLSGILLKILKRLEEHKRYLIVSTILFIYLMLVGLSPSILRGVLFFYLFSINKIYYFYIKNINLYIIALSITLLINPFYIYDSGFLYSFTISLGLLLSTDYLKSNNYFISLLKTSFISFLCSLPISLYNYCSINILSIIYNLFFVPFISIIIFPLSLLTSFIKVLEPIYNFLIIILEKISLLLLNIKVGKLIFKRVFIGYYLLLIILIFIYIIKRNKKILYILLFILTIHYISPIYTNKALIKMIDVNQGDSILINKSNKTILIDTGGIRSRENTIIRNTTIPILKSMGIKKIDYLILTHGDYDHLGEALYLIKYFNVDKIVINCNYINYLENKIIDIKKSIIGEEELNIKIGELNLIQLNEDLKDENDSSQIYYLTYKDKKVLLTGDASIKSEENMLNKYELDNIDILKVGHHGSKTSTSERLLNELKPKLAIMSLGKDNKFGHPNKETIDKLKKYKVKYYRTDISGTITILLDTLHVFEESKSYN